MKATSAYSQYHPKWHRTRVSTYWWIRQWSYLKFIMRELTSIFVAYFVVLTLLQLDALTQGPEAYTHFLQWLKTPVLIVFNGISFLFVMFHTITWFNLTPRAMPIRIGGKRIPDILVAAPNYLVWLAVSAFLTWLLLGA